jgi:hypothetical protein
MLLRKHRYLLTLLCAPFKLSNGKFLFAVTVYIFARKNQLFFTKRNIDICANYTKSLFLQLRFVNLQKSFAGFLQFAPFDIS